MTRNQFAEAIPVWRKALESDPDDGEAHLNLAYALRHDGDARRSAGGVPQSLRSQSGRPDGVRRIRRWRWRRTASRTKPSPITGKSLALNAGNAEVQADLGALLYEKGDTAEGLEHLEKAVALNPESADAHNKLAAALVKNGQTAEATAHLEKAVELAPDSVEYRFSLAYVLGLAERFTEAIPQLQKAVELSGGKDWQCYDMLGAMYSKTGRPSDAVEAGRRALDLAAADHNEELVRALRSQAGRIRAGQVTRAGLRRFSNRRAG